MIVLNFYGAGYHIHSFLVLVSCDALSAGQETGEILQICIIFHFP